MLLAVILADHSTRSLGAWAVLVELADLCAVAWLGWLLSVLLAVSPASSPPTCRRVRLIDATRFGQVGRGGDAWRIYWDDDLTAGRLEQVVATDQTGGEHLGRSDLAPDDIIVADSGYGYRRTVALTHAARADIGNVRYVRAYGQMPSLRASLAQPLFASIQAIPCAGCPTRNLSLPSVVLLVTTGLPMTEVHNAPYPCYCTRAGLAAGPPLASRGDRCPCVDCRRRCYGRACHPD